MYKYWCYRNVRNDSLRLKKSTGWTEKSPADNVTHSRGLAEADNEGWLMKVAGIKIKWLNFSWNPAEFCGSLIALYLFHDSGNLIHNTKIKMLLYKACFLIPQSNFNVVLHGAFRLFEFSHSRIIAKNALNVAYSWSILSDSNEPVKFKNFIEVPEQNGEVFLIDKSFTYSAFTHRSQIALKTSRGNKQLFS